MSKALFMNVSAPGHVYPTFGLVAELVRRGEEVVYFEHPPFQAEIEAFGAAFRPMPMPGPYPGPPSANQFNIAPVMTWYTREMLSALLEAVRAEKPDYIVHDSLCLWGRLIAEILGIPAVNSIASAAFNARSFYGAPPFWAVAPGMWLDARPQLRRFREWERELRRVHGVRRTSFLDTFTNPEGLNVCYLPRELQPYADSFGGRFHFVGPCDPIRHMEHDFPLDSLDPGRLVYISFGTHHDPGTAFYRACIEAFRGSEWQVLLLLSPAMDPAALGEIPPGFIVRRTGTVPQLEILRRTRLFLSHAGGNAIRESTWFGVPSLLVPQTYEQDVLARQMERVGAGIRLSPKRVDAKRIGALARKISADPSYAEASRRIGESSRLSGGAPRAADLILDYARRSTRNSSG